MNDRGMEFLLNLGVPRDQARSMCISHSIMFHNMDTPHVADSHLFAENIQRIASHSLSPDEGLAIKRIGKEFDFLGIQSSKISLRRSLNLVAMSTLQPKNRIAIVTTVRNEGPILLEWLAHHRAIGVEHFFIYTNDNEDGSDELLALLSRAQDVTVIFNEFEDGINPQFKAVEHSLHFLVEARMYKWILYTDADEFLSIDKVFDYNVQNYLSAVEKHVDSASISTIVFNWIWIGSSGHIDLKDDLLRVRFIHGRQHTHVKSLVRIQNVKSMIRIHKPDLIAGLCFTSGLDKTIEQTPDSVFDDRGGHLLHFWNRSYAEFLIKKHGAIPPRDDEMFFEWDVPATADHRIDFPGELAERVSIEISNINMDPAIARIAKDIRVRQNVLLELASRGEPVAVIHSRGRAYHDATRHLQSKALAGRPDISQAMLSDVID